MVGLHVHVNDVAHSCLCHAPVGTLQHQGATIASPHTIRGNIDARPEQQYAAQGSHHTKKVVEISVPRPTPDSHTRPKLMR